MGAHPLLKEINDGPGVAAIARALKLSRQRVWQWFNRTEIPAKFVLDVERITGIPRSELRPDLYPPERELITRRRKTSEAA